MDTIKADVLVESALRDAATHLGKVMDGDVIFLKVPMQQPVDDVVRAEVERLVERSTKRRSKLLVVVETNGGFVETVERIVSSFRRHYSTVEFIVPNYAYSAGTLLVLSGDEIHMDYYSVLGPIDPQYPADDGNYVPGMGYLAKFKELIEKINNPPDDDETRVRAEMALLIKKFDPAKLFHIEQSIDHAKQLLTEWLPRYKFKDWNRTETRDCEVTESDKKARAEEIAAVLGDAARWHSHGRGITIRELASEEIKLVINDFGADPKLNVAVRNYYGLVTDYMQKKVMKAAIHTIHGLRRI